jgi:RND family efflux transporter MFP subunit
MRAIGRIAYRLLRPAGRKVSVMRSFATFRAAYAAIAGLGLLLCAALLLSGCEQQSTAGAGAGAPPVTVAYPIEKEVTNYEDYTGRTAAIESVQVTARVTGYLDKIYFLEGAEVKVGTVLYEIDPRPYQAAFDQAKAQAAQSQAALDLAKANRVRYEELYQKKVATAQDVETYRSTEAQAAATLAASQANLETARLNLGWTKVTAPVAGQLGHTLVSRGNLVTADQTPLTTMVSLDPMYVYFDVDEATVERIQQLIREGKFKSSLPQETGTPGSKGPQEPGAGPVVSAAVQKSGPLAIAIDELTQHADQLRQVYLGLANEANYPHVAYIDFVNNQLNLATATLQVRGIFWNHKPPIGPRVFNAGMFVRVRVPTSPTFQGLLVSQEAIQTNQNLKYVDVINDQDEVARRDVTLGGIQDGLQVIAKGLASKERVVISGMQHVKPGGKVTPKLIPMPVMAETAQSPTSSPQVKAQEATSKSGQE